MCLVLSNNYQTIVEMDMFEPMYHGGLTRLVSDDISICRAIAVAVGEGVPRLVDDYISLKQNGAETLASAKAKDWPQSTGNRVAAELERVPM